MERPNINDYPIKEEGKKLRYYNDDLNKYIAYLEETNKALTLTSVSNNEVELVCLDCENSFTETVPSICYECEQKRTKTN